MSVLDDLESDEGFTHAERDIADFILEHSDEVVRMSISDLAKATYSSNATVIRLCRKLGAQGYRDFRVVLAADIERSRKERRVLDMDRPFDQVDDVAGIISALGSLLGQAISDTYASVSAEDVRTLAQMVHDASLIYIFGVGDSQISGMAFANRLMKLGVHVIMAGQYGESLAVSTRLSSDDLAIVISYSGKIVNSYEMRHVMQNVLESGCRSAWISSAPKPFGFEVGLRFPARETRSGKIGTFYSQMCIRYILECVYGVVWAFDYADNSERKTALDDLDVTVSFLENL